MYNLRLLASLILSVIICLVQLTACAPHQPLSKQEESASLERLQNLKQELASLKRELAAARDREAQVEKHPAPELEIVRHKPGWVSRTESAPIPSGYGYHATLVAGKEHRQEELVRLLTLIEALQIDATTSNRKQTLFVVPGLGQAEVGLSVANYDELQAVALLEGWPGSDIGSGPYLLIAPSAEQEGPGGRLLIKTAGLSVRELKGLLDLLQKPRATNTASLLIKLLQFRSDLPASVTSHGADFSLGWH